MRRDLRVQRGISRGQPFQIQLNGEPLPAYPGETIATVLFAAGIHGFHHTIVYGEPRGLFCGMGLCYDCLVTVNGEANVRACHTLAQPGDRVECQIK